MMRLRIGTGITILAAALAFFAIEPAYPDQSFERGIKEIDRNVRQEIEKKIVPKPEGAPAIEEPKEEVKEEGPKVFIKKIELTGCETFPQDRFKPFIESRENKEVTLGELKRLAKEIEREYLREGLVAACIVPPQDVKDGVVKLKVIESRMGELVIMPHKFFNNRILKRYWETKKGEILKYSRISRSLQRMNRNPDREVKSTLSAGKEPRTTDVTLTATTYFPAHFSFTFDREGAATTGKARIGYAGRHNNLLGLDDTLIAGYLSSTGSDNLYAYHSIPLSGFGTSMMYGFSRSEAFPGGDFESYDLRSYSKSASVFFYQDIFDKDKAYGDISLGLDGNDKNVYTNDGVLNKDRLRVLRMAANIYFQAFGGMNYIRPELSQGLNILGARSGLFASRNAGNEFTKFKIDLTHRKTFVHNIQLVLKGSAQCAGEKLTPQEEFAMGGIDSVRGYPFGDYYADSAIQLNVELLVPPAFLPDTIRMPYARTPLKDNIQGLLFFDYAYGTRRGRIEGEKTRDRMASVGTGVRIRLYDQIYFRLEMGVPLPFADVPMSESCPARVHISLDIDEQLHKEIARIEKMVRNNAVVR